MQSPFIYSRITGRSEGIDLLRGILALHVLVFAHLVFWADILGQRVPQEVLIVARAYVSVFQGHGELNPAVLAFIVLSGYSIHRNGLRVGDSIRPFLVRRAFRILPIFFFGTLLGIQLFIWSADVDATAATLLTGTEQIRLRCVAGKISTLAALGPMFHPCDFLGNAPLLTVMVEAVLYAVYAAAYFFREKWMSFIVVAASVMAGLFIAARSISTPVLYNWWENSSVLAFLPFWWMGAIAVEQSTQRKLARFFPLLIFIWFVITVASHWESAAIIAEIRKFVLAAIIGRLIGILDRPDIPKNLLSAVGRASYSIYALHAPILAFTLIVGIHWWQSGLIAIGIGVLTFFALESPLERFGRTVARHMRTRIDLAKI